PTASRDVDRGRHRADDGRPVRRPRAPSGARRRPGARRGRPVARARCRFATAHGHADPAARPVLADRPRAVVMPGIQSVTAPDATRWLPFDELDRLLDALRADGRTLIGPVVRDEAIILDEIASAADLPAGRGVETAPGRYRLTRRADAKRFDHAVGPMSPKRFTFPPRAPIRVGR